jgi:hypothetical protein
MPEYHFNFEKITAKHMKILFGLSELEPELFFQYLCTLLERAGINLDNVHVDEMYDLVDAFMLEMDQHFAPWSNTNEDEGEQARRAQP